MKHTIQEFVEKHLPARISPNFGYRIMFIAELNGKKWNINVKNSHAGVATKAIAIKKGSKGKTESTRMEFDFVKTDTDFIVKDSYFTLISLTQLNRS